MKRENKRRKINIMKSILEKVKKILKNTLTKVIFINLIVFILSNIVFGIKYEEVDDFITFKSFERKNPAMFQKFKTVSDVFKRENPTGDVILSGDEWVGANREKNICL